MGHIRLFPCKLWGSCPTNMVLFYPLSPGLSVVLGGLCRGGFSRRLPKLKPFP